METMTLTDEEIRVKTHLVEVIDHQETGRLARQYRKACNVSLRSVARWMKISPMFLSDLERGNRNWTERLVELFNWAVRKAK